MAVNKVVLGDQTLIDLTADSVTPDKLFKGITAHNMKGESIVGTMEGGSTPSEPSDNTAVIFADYDGNLIDTWTKDEVASKTTLPTPPAHTGLVFEGWNWTLEDIKTDTTGQVITVGPYYHTESGLTEIDIHLDKYVTKTITFNQLNVSNLISMDWGDGSTEIAKVHTYSNYGDYTIKIQSKNDTMLDLYPESQQLQDWSMTELRLANNINYISAWWHRNLSRVAIPSKKMQWGSWVFTNCPLVQLTIPSEQNFDNNIWEGYQLKYLCFAKDSPIINQPQNMVFKGEYIYFPDGTKYIISSPELKKIVVPSSVTSIGSSAFSGCSSLQSITIPESVTSIESYTFYNCSSLQSITIPESVTSIKSNAFSNCSSLKNINIPSSVTSIGSSAFSGCSSLQSITIPESVTSIGQNAFYRCSSLQSITIPESVTSIGDDACSGLHNCNIYKINSSAKIGSYTYKSGGSYMQISYDFSECSAIPVLSSSNGIANKDEIYMIIVPDSLYDEWIAATNWVAYASKIKKASEVGNTEVAG